MVRLETVFLPSVRGLDREQLDEICADGRIFARPSWFELLESVDLNEITSGDVRLSFATVFANGRSELVLPILRARGPAICFLYSLRRFYFESWIDGAVRLRPNKRRPFAKLFAAVAKFQQLLEWTGAPLDDYWIVGSPLSNRCHPAASPSAPVERAALYRRLLADLQRLSRSTRKPLWFLGVEDCGPVDPWRMALRRSGCAESFFGYDNVLKLDRFETFDDYLDSFPRSRRMEVKRSFQREVGVDVRQIRDFGDSAQSLAALDQMAVSRSATDGFHLPPSFWRMLAENCGDDASAFAEFRGDEMAGFSVLLESMRRGEMHVFRSGRRDDDGGLSRCELAAIRRAIKHGCRKLSLGPGDERAKRSFGAEQIPLYSYFWFPRRFDRWILQRYLRVFGRIARKQLDRSMEREAVRTRLSEVVEV